MVSGVLAALFGIALFPLVLVFPPVYWPWSLLIMAACGAIVGLTVRRPLPRGAFVAAALVAVTVVVTIGVGRLSRNFGVDLAAVLYWIRWLYFPVLVGAMFGAMARARLGLPRGAAAAAAATLLIGAGGAVLEVVLAPRDVAAIPYCERDPTCPREPCWMMAERRRLFAWESVDAFDDQQISCAYTAWGGLHIGTVTAGARESRWDDGDWPSFVAGRGR